MLKEGKFRALQICYSKGKKPYLTGLAPVIPSPELSPPDGAVQSDFERLSSTLGGLDFPEAVVPKLALPTVLA